MGTNYYLREPSCPTCGSTKQELHIGKDSGGWQFHFRGYIESDIISYKDWQREFASSPRKKIYDEYDQEISFEEFDKMVRQKKSGLNHTNCILLSPETLGEEERIKERPFQTPDQLYSKTWKDSEGNPFTGVDFC